MAGPAGGVGTGWRAAAAALAAVLALGVVRPGRAVSATPGSAPYVWWEGEAPESTNFPADSGFAASGFATRRRLLSGGDWLSVSGKRTGEPASARYRVTVPADGGWSFWTRKFWKHGPFRWRFDDQPWTVCPRDVALADSVTLAPFLCANWVHLGAVTLTAGPHVMELELLAAPGEEQTAAFDCFVLVQGLFEPRGRTRPDAPPDPGDAGYVPWDPGLDPFPPDALLDLRRLNERTAGEDGFVKRKADRFVLGSGRPVRFWGVDAGPEVWGLDADSVAYLARRLAKSGVNLVRVHGASYDGTTGRVDPAAVGRVQRFVAALKAEGIYASLSFYFPLWLEAGSACGLPEYDGAKERHPFALLFFDDRMRDLWRGWARALLTTPDPAGGPPLGRNPAVALIEMQNEDSCFFWTFNHDTIPAADWTALERRFGAWVVARYGSAGAARAAWVEAREKGDDLANGRAALYDAWGFTTDGLKGALPGRRRRASDQVRFLGELQREFYATNAAWLRKALGVRSLIEASNWTTADPSVLDGPERWVDAAGDLIDHHGYFGGKHEGEGAEWSVREGHTFRNAAAVRSPADLPIQTVRIAGYPATISELGWTNPNRYRADETFIAAAYGALQGVDAMDLFAVGGAFWDREMVKFPVSTPLVLGSFPAAALLYRRGDVAEGPEVVHQVVPPEDLFALKPTGGFAAQALDATRIADVPPGGAVAGLVNAVDPLAFYAGKVVRAYGGKAADSRQANLAGVVDRDASIVRSLTGELVWDWGRGIVTLDSPRARGACGFLSQRASVTVTGAAIEIENEYAAVLLVSLDGAPLETSKRILVQAVTAEQPVGFKTSEPQEGTIQDLGSGPLELERVHGAIALGFGGESPPKVVALDAFGRPRPDAIAVTGDGKGSPWRFRLADDAIHHVVLR